MFFFRFLLNLIPILKLSMSISRCLPVKTQNDLHTTPCNPCVYKNKFLILTAKYDVLQKKYKEIEKDNKMIRSQLRVFTNKELRTVKPIIKERCNICAAMLTREQLAKHLCMDGNEITCEYCMETFKSTIDFSSHLKYIGHSNMKFYKCDKCTMGFRSPLLRDFHQNSERIHPATTTEPEIISAKKGM